MAGIAALSLVANELGRRTQLSPPARLLLSGGLGGLGVISVAIKVGIVSVLSLTGGQGGLSASGKAARAWVNAYLPEAMAPPAPMPRVATDGFRTWRALPTTAPAPRDNPASPEKVALGRKLFHDKTLSRDRSLSCASCHGLAQGGVTMMRGSRPDTWGGGPATATRPRC